MSEVVGFLEEYGVEKIGPSGREVVLCLLRILQSTGIYFKYNGGMPDT